MTELELLRILYIIIRKVMGLGYINLKREGAGKRGCKKSNYTNIDSVNNILILLLLGGQILTNNSIDSDIKKIKLNMIDLGQKKIDFIKDED